MTRATRLSLLLALAITTAGGSAFAAPVDYIRSIKPILATRCYACHGALKQKHNLRVDTAALLKQGGDSGPALVSGDSRKSLLMQYLTGARAGKRMPPASEGDPLPEREIALFRAWIDQGAPAPADEKPEPDPRDHWAFRPPVRPAVPRVHSPGRNPVDAFLAAEQEKRGLTPQPAAERAVLLRRVYLDLIGLPPTHDELGAFLADQSPDAYEKVVDHLLASSQYGERWGRHWMDVWRYSDPWGLGAEVRNSQPHIWHWRDWIIQSLNQDKGYDQMVREMLAADELYPSDLDRLRATGYLVRSYFLFNRNSWLDEVVEHTSKSFLGLTLNCTKCHDHKYDPFAQQDYYRLRAFFEPYQVRMDMVPGEASFSADGIPRVYDCNAGTPTYLFVRGDEKRPDTGKPLAPGLPTLLVKELTIQPVTLPLDAEDPGLRPFVLANYLHDAEQKIVAAREALRQAKEKPAIALAEKALAAAELQPKLHQARAAADAARHLDPAGAEAKELARQAARVEHQVSVAAAEESLARAELDLARAEAAKKADAEKMVAAARKAVADTRKALENPGDKYTSLRGALKSAESNLESAESLNRPFPATSTGRRSALARWMTDRRNPLTARVAVNHIWARHFGKPLVPTVFDFGRKGTPPTHPELLDWLAVEFMESGWSMKHLHRLLVTSDAYRRGSSTIGAASATLAADPENRWYWRRDPVRMEAEVVRDSLLHLAGELDLRQGGPPIPVANEASRRRSLYYVHSHNDHHKFLALFDEAGVLECYRRAESIVPQQALALENSGTAQTAAEKIARRLGDQPDAVFVRAAFETILGTPPSADEQAACLEALHELTRLAGAARARTDLVHALLNHNDFITIR